MVLLLAVCVVSSIIAQEIIIDPAVPPGAAALGYMKCVINESPTAADIAPGDKGNYKWFSGQWWGKAPSLDHYSTQDGVLVLTLGGDLVSTPRDFSTGKLPLLPGADGFYVEFDVRLSDNDPDHFPAVWLMPAEHNRAKSDVYSGDPPEFERWMELDVDEGNFGPGLMGSVVYTWGIYPNWERILNDDNHISPLPLDRSQKHTFGASYDPMHRIVTWWVDGVKQMSAGSPHVPDIAAKQHFYLILSAQSHGKQKPYSMFVSGVRAYVPQTGLKNSTGASIPFDPLVKPIPVRIVDAREADAAPAPTVLARLANRKLAPMVRDKNGKMQPWYIRGIEHHDMDKGQINMDYADLYTDEYLDRAFADYQKLGANTSFFTIHWADIEPEDGHFDFSRLDRIVAHAKKYDIHIWWVLFIHTQPSHCKRLHDFWVYRLDSHDGVDGAIQWQKNDKGESYKTVEQLLTGKTEVYPSYSHPKVFPRVIRMIHALGKHYKDSDAVIGVQIGNEEGFSYNTAPVSQGKWDSDFGPASQAFYEDWKLKTGKSDWRAFKMAAVKWWWRQFTTAFHEEDLYKLTSFNLAGGLPEMGDELMINMEGVDSTTFGEGNIDVIGTMFYGWTDKLWRNLDQHYDYLYNLPILVPSEVGIGPCGSKTHFQECVIQILERGGQGYAAYVYFVLVDDQGQINKSGVAYQKLASMIKANEDVLYSGVPGPGAVSLETSATGAKISQLHNEAQTTLGVMHFPEVYMEKDIDARTDKVDVTVSLKASNAGQYAIETYRDGKLQATENKTLDADQSIKWTIPAVLQTEAVFIKVKKLN